MRHRKSGWGWQGMGSNGRRQQRQHTHLSTFERVHQHHACVAAIALLRGAKGCSRRVDVSPSGRFDTRQQRRRKRTMLPSTKIIIIERGRVHEEPKIVCQPCCLVCGLLPQAGRTSVGRQWWALGWARWQGVGHTRLRDHGSVVCARSQPACAASETTKSDLTLCSSDLRSTCMWFVVPVSRLASSVRPAASRSHAA